LPVDARGDPGGEHSVARFERSEPRGKGDLYLFRQRRPVEDEHSVLIQRRLDLTESVRIHDLREIGTRDLADVHRVQLANDDCHDG
jgi:hypothetical protein